MRIGRIPWALACGLFAATFAVGSHAAGTADSQDSATQPPAATRPADTVVQPAADETESMAAGNESDIQVAEVAICRKVESRTAVEPDDSFAADVDHLFCFTDVRGAGQPQRIFHRWYVGEELVSEVPMDVQGSRWRCWSEKTISPRWSGPCRVEIVTEQGEQIGQASFDLVAAADDLDDAMDVPAADDGAH